MRILYIQGSLCSSMDVDLDHDDEVIDPRHIMMEDEMYILTFSVKGRTLTITRIDTHDDDEGWGGEGFRLRAYRRSTEDIPDPPSTLTLVSMVNVPLLIPRKSSFIRPLLSSRTWLSVNVNPWCGSQYLTPSQGLKRVLSRVVIP